MTPKYILAEKRAATATRTTVNIRCLNAHCPSNYHWKSTRRCTRKIHLCTDDICACNILLDLYYLFYTLHLPREILEHHLNTERQGSRQRQQQQQRRDVNRQASKIRKREHLRIPEADGRERPPCRLRDSPDEGKAATLAREAVARDVNVAHLAASLEHASQVLRRCSVREIVDFQGDHPVDAGRRPTVAHLAYSDVGSFPRRKRTRSRRQNYWWNIQRHSRAERRIFTTRLGSGARRIWRMNRTMATCDDGDQWRRISQWRRAKRRASRGQASVRCRDESQFPA